MSQAQIERKVEDYLRKSQALEDHWQRPLTAEQLQAEMDRMAKQTQQPEVLHELFDALGNDAFVIAECLARPVLTERLVGDLSARDNKAALRLLAHQRSAKRVDGNDCCKGPLHSSANCRRQPFMRNDNWASTCITNAPDGRIDHSAVWTGSEMIVWGGENYPFVLNTGGRYNPSTDSWTATSTTNAPDARGRHTAVWTGSEMIVWGGRDAFSRPLNTGGRYNPATDSWTHTSIRINPPLGREGHTAVWTGSQMIIWGGAYHGVGPPVYFNTGGRYNPSTDIGRTPAPPVRLLVASFTPQCGRATK